MLVFLALNGIELTYTQKTLDIILSLAVGIVGMDKLLQWIIKHQEQ